MSRADPARSSRSTIAAVVGLGLLAACSGSVSLGDGDPGREGSPVMELLGWVPDPPGELEQIFATDFERASSVLAVERPQDCPAGDPALEKYRDALFVERIDAGVQAPQLLRDVLVEPGALEVSFGIQLCEIIAALDADPGTLVMRVESSADDIDRAVNADPVWAEFLSVDQTGGQTFYDWGDELFRGPPGPARRLAEGGQLAVIDDVAIRTRERAVLEAHLGAANGRSVVDRRYVPEVVTALEGRGAYSIFLTELAPSASRVGLLEEIPEDLAAALDLDADAGLLRWQLLGLGAALADDGEPVVVIAMAHTTDVDATENADRFRSVIETGRSFAADVPWRDLVALEDLSTEGEILTATLRGVDRSAFAVALGAVFSSDTMFRVAG